MESFKRALRTANFGLLAPFHIHVSAQEKIKLFGVSATWVFENLSKKISADETFFAPVGRISKI